TKPCSACSTKTADCRLKLPVDIWTCCAKKDPCPPISTPRSWSIFPCCRQENNKAATEERLLDPRIVHYGKGMEIKYELISADSHAAFDRDDFTRRMSVSKWQDRIPRVLEVEDNGRRVHRWTVYDGPPYQESV